MAVKLLPGTIPAMVRMYATDATAQQMYEDMSCSAFSGDPEYDFPDKEMQEVHE